MKPVSRDGSFAQWLQDRTSTGCTPTTHVALKPAILAAFVTQPGRTLSCVCRRSGPGWDATRATKITAVVKRANGAVYDQYWQAAIDAHADIVTITSYNEWHEGTQIEASTPKCIPNYCYVTDEGAYGQTGEAAGNAYLARTLHWTTVAKGSAPTLNERLLVMSSALSRNDGEVINRYKAMNVRPAS